MAKIKKEIHESIRLGKTVFTPGDEDELAEVMTAAQVKNLTERGLISGFPVPEVDEIEDGEFKVPTQAQLSKMSKADLVVVANKLGIEVTPDSMSNKEIIALVVEGN